MMIIALPLIVFVIFNLALRVIVYENTKDDLENAFDMVQVLVKEEYLSSSLENKEDGQEIVKDTLTALVKAIRLANRTQKTELFFIGNNGNYIFPRDFSESEISSELMTDILNKIKENETLHLNETFQESYDKKDYLVNVSSIKTGNTRLRQNTLIIISPLVTSSPLIVKLNVILAVIILLAIVIGSLIAKKISKDIASPIIHASEHAQSISNGQYAVLNLKPNSKEIEILYSSLNHMSRTLKKSEEAQVNYFQNLSHDLRTPLMSIQGYAEGIQEGIFEDSAFAAEIIKTESIRLKNLVDQLLTLSKLENSYSKLKDEAFVVKEIIDEIVMRHYGLCQNKTITINAPDHLQLKMDLSIFDKILSNVLSNAIKYAKHIVVIDVVEINHQVQITIQDDGPGIEGDTDEIFKRFYKGKDGNFGLGLAIVATAMDLIGGQVRCENYNKGAMFILTFNK